MDYVRIYGQFIEDRRRREPLLTGYSERHHILPRSLGGGDVADNLIRLTAEDHYFAHCCLAKMHGGKMWSALFAIAHMAKTDRAAAYFAKRRMVRAARENAAKRRSENMRELWASGSFQRNRTYRPWTADERAQHSNTLRVLGGPGAEAIARAVATRQARAARYRFRHRDGREFVGTARDLRATFGLFQSSVSRMVNGKLRTVSGWRLDQTTGEPTA